MIAIQILAKMVATVLTVSIHILVRAPRDLMEPTVKPVSKILLIVVSSLDQLWFFFKYVCLSNAIIFSFLMMNSILVVYAGIKRILSSFLSAWHYDLCMYTNVIF